MSHTSCSCPPREPARAFFSFEEFQFVFYHHALKDEEKRMWLWIAGHYMHACNAPAAFSLNDIARVFNEEPLTIYQIIMELYEKKFISIDLPCLDDPLHPVSGRVKRAYTPLIPDTDGTIKKLKIHKFYKNYVFFEEARYQKPASIEAIFDEYMLKKEKEKGKRK